MYGIIQKSRLNWAGRGLLICTNGESDPKSEHKKTRILHQYVYLGEELPGPYYKDKLS